MRNFHYLINKDEAKWEAVVKDSVNVITGFLKKVNVIFPIFILRNGYYGDRTGAVFNCRYSSLKPAGYAGNIFRL